MSVYLAFVVILVLISCVDLVVGVSNDAVNFLNSAIGSKVASFKTILIIASVGILMGSIFSNGMMEVARKGIFNPSYFTFDKVMIIFLAVMLTDVILLDIYNTLGLPTSTTVSLIFELLGASFVTGLITISERDENIAQLGEIINTASALKIIGGIFLSIAVSFVVGSFVQYVSRMVFSFRTKKTIRIFGPAFSALSITVIVYFLLIKGMKGTTIISAELKQWIDANTIWLLFAFFLIFSALFQILTSWQKVNSLRVVVLFGTFSLAMAFAGNDLVNFIGVSVAGLMSFTAWSGSGVPAEEFQMDILNQPAASPTWLLLSAGVIMVITLWTNAKSRKVTETEIALGKQGEGDELFSSNFLSRLVVGSALFFGSRINRVTPAVMGKWIDKRFSKKGVSQDDGSSFDLVRAAVNMLVASALIAFGTSQKLPLSTTFVTFMVAMGTSFADKAWGRESAVYRIAGVFHVIAGWFGTAIVAFVMSGLTALTIYFTGTVGIILLLIFGTFLLVQSHLNFSKKAKAEKSLQEDFVEEVTSTKDFLDQVKINTTKNLKTIHQLMHSTLELLDGKSGRKKEAVDVKRLLERNEKLNQKIIRQVRKIDKSQLVAGRFNIFLFDILQDLFQSASFIYEISKRHVTNHHVLPDKDYRHTLKKLDVDIDDYFEKITAMIKSLDFSAAGEMENRRDRILSVIDAALDKQIAVIQKGAVGNRMGLLQTRLLLELKDIVQSLYQICSLYKDFVKSELSEAVR